MRAARRSRRSSNLARDNDSFLSGAHPGVIDATEQSGKGVKTLGSISPQCEVSGGRHIGGPVQRVDNLITTSVSALIEGDLRNVKHGVGDPELATVALCPDYDSPERRKLIEETTQAFRDGKIKPTAPRISTGPPSSARSSWRRSHDLS